MDCIPNPPSRTPSTRLLRLDTPYAPYSKQGRESKFSVGKKMVELAWGKGGGGRNYQQPPCRHLIWVPHPFPSQFTAWRRMDAPHGHEFSWRRRARIEAVMHRNVSRLSSNLLRSPLTSPRRRRLPTPSSPSLLGTTQPGPPLIVVKNVLIAVAP